MSWSVTERVPGMRLQGARQRLGALGGEAFVEGQADLLRVLEAHVGERADLVGDDLAALLADLEGAAHVDRLVGGDAGLVLAVGLRPDDHLDRAALVLEVEGRVAVALLVVLELQGVDDAAGLDLLLVLAGRRGRRSRP